MEQPNSPSAQVLGQDQEQGASASSLGESRAARGTRRVKQGRVASNKMDKTIVVVSETRVPHAAYGKIVRKSARFKAHDERNEANIGDVVRIVECRPMSREKRWRLVEIVERAK
ncbi:MAG TPA: 30S ribosomal protein S17 [Candidatus Acidoferrales bacterium]|jgi:small subunit ribosomal protein S17|nr:30S ribosomal protein S17 [Candidatus Acidoferrales bacterium]